MFSMKDYREIDQNYFQIINASGFTFTLRSKNTCHEWHMTEQELKNRNISYKLLHRHKGGTYHLQGHFKSFSQAIEYIQSHDKNQIEVRGR